MVSKVMTATEESYEQLVPGSVLASKLFKAVLGCGFSEVRRILRCNVRIINTTNNKGHNILIAALFIVDDSRRQKMFDYLLRKGGDSCFVDPKTGMCVLSWACCLGRKEEVSMVIRNALGNIDLRSKDFTGRVPLHHACIVGDSEIVRAVLQEMIKYRLPVDVSDDVGLTPYLYARRLGFDHVAAILNETGKASKKQFDSVTYRSATFWMHEGAKERRICDYNKLKEEQRWLRILGKLSSVQREKNCYLQKLPTIKITDSQTDNTKSVLSRSMNDEFLTERFMDEVSLSKSCGNFPKRRPKTQVQFRVGHNDLRFLLNADERSTSKLTESSLKQHDALTSDAAANEPFNATMRLLAEIKGEHVQHFVSSVRDDDVDGEHGASQNYHNTLNLSAMFDVLSNQSSVSYRRTTVKPPTPPPPKPEKRSKKKNCSSLAIIMGRDRRRKDISKNDKKTKSGKSSSLSALDQRKKKRKSGT